MIRPMTSDVSALSSVVAKGHQAIHFVSSAPSKIPYGGFSPVRLQDQAPGQFSKEPSARPRRLKSDPDIPQALAAFAPAFGWACDQTQPRLRVRDAGPHSATWPQRPSLRLGYSVPALIA